MGKTGRDKIVYAEGFKKERSVMGMGMVSAISNMSLGVDDERLVIIRTW
jgi:hypothetical protein